jgi:hypothetical protein
MKKTILLFIIFSCAALAASRGQKPTQNKQEIEYKPIIEKVTVTNIEVPVRVLYKNKPVTDLTKNDFIIYEDNKKMEINDYIQKLEEKIKVPEIKIGNFSFQGKVLVFTVKDYMMKEAGSNSVGRMKVRIRLTNSDEALMLYDQEKICTAQNNEMKVSLGAFKNIARGEYHFFIDATDLLTGKQANVHQNIIVKQ